MKALTQAVRSAVTRSEGLRDGFRLPFWFPVLKFFRDLSPDARRRLEPAYERYVCDVSIPEMAISLDLAVFLDVFCQLTAPTRILDLGSGFSSFVFRSYAAKSSHQPQVCSVDDSSQWLGRTELFLQQYGLRTDNLVDWDSFSSRQTEPFDIVLYDLGAVTARMAKLERVLATVRREGVIVCDDAHKKKYGPPLRRGLAQMGYRFFSLRAYTLDDFGRFSMLAIGGEASDASLKNG